MEKNVLLLDFNSNIFLARDAIRKAMKFIRENFPNISPEDEGDLRLIFTEIIYNSVLHGNNCDARKKVTVGLRIDGDVVFSEISDEGEGFDHEERRACRKDSESPESAETAHGRGITLAVALSDGVCYNAKGNSVRIHKKVTRCG